MTRGRPRPAWLFVQSGVIPVRPGRAGPEVLLITSRKRRRWTIPKGVVEAGLTPAASAAKEAWEEAGIRGEVDPEPVGRYAYAKWGGTCRVAVFRMAVREVADRWPEAWRDRRWVPLGDAAGVVGHDGLRDLLREVAARWADGGGGG